MWQNEQITEQEPGGWSSAERTESQKYATLDKSCIFLDHYSSLLCNNIVQIVSAALEKLWNLEAQIWEPWKLLKNISFGAPEWLSQLSVWLPLRSWSRSCEFEPRIGLCADSVEPGAHFDFCVSHSLSLSAPPLLILSLFLCLSKTNKHSIFKNKIK